MNFRFLENPDYNIGIFDNVSGGGNNHIGELIQWSRSNNIQLQEDALDYYEHDLNIKAEDRKKYADTWNARNYEIDKYPILYNVVYEEIVLKIRKLFNYYLSSIGEESYSDESSIELSTLHLMKEGDRLDRHFDLKDYGLVYYIQNWGNFSGGELHFSGINEILAPVPDRLVIIPSNMEHEVLPITSGFRLSATAFVSLK